MKCGCSNLSWVQGTAELHLQAAVGGARGPSHRRGQLGVGHGHAKKRGTQTLHDCVCHCRRVKQMGSNQLISYNVNYEQALKYKR